jgi:8-oxo-dGTP pyrophosphatase MutT (NUDIX family)
MLEFPVMNVPSRANIVSRLAQTPASSAMAAPKPAGVLIPIVTHLDPSVLFTLRTADLPSHAGQICFPGGRFHETDRDLTESALREAEEETGIPRERIEVAGFLDPYVTTTGYSVLPVVGFVQPGFTLAPDQREVAGVFEVPLLFLLDPANRDVRMVERDGRQRAVYSIAYAGHRIWGATAGMIVNLSEKLSA